jgi:Ca-activated chloride channel homolog
MIQATGTLCIITTLSLFVTESRAQDQEPPEKKPVVVKKYDNPHHAYKAGHYDQSLQHFIDQQIDQPEDAKLMMNIGAAHYSMNNFPEATKAFQSAALRGDKALRAKAFYNLGNVAYREGKLEEAITYYQQTLENDSTDQDAKYNVEFVRDEIRRRHEEAKKQQEKEGQQKDSPSQNQEKQNEKNQDGKKGDEPQSEQGSSNDSADSQPRDSDQDGLNDEQEKNAANPTDPENPDTDGDGLKDGEEDLNKNGRVDPGENDPNKKDTDADGIPDAQEAKAGGKEDAQSDEEKNMSPEEGVRYLQTLEEGRPNKQKRVRKGARRRSRKDW